MRVLFDGKVSIAYCQMYVTSREEPGMEEACAGQVNGICGARIASSLFLMTGSHDGRVGLRVELHDREPPAAGPEWEEVVEVPFQPRDATAELDAVGASRGRGARPAFRRR